ncbi:max dimerization protein 1-like isoform X2 [Pollicipes pollicipes]|uniref:max dimerization protein 1-like isoform X2 n=1 Tax=Pollicipes pollicipes TaxID=41117 RepID=UPI00188552C4|nr:max dimerization protein 1-like isoform X2 [Pollicipes pollicipes]
MSIAALIEAADFLERREREAEHGYAIVSIIPADIHRADSKHKIKKHLKARKSFNSRSTHNELEKNRRAHLRTCLERLREDVPPGPDANRHTTLGLLTRARDYIRSLEEKDRMNDRYKDQLAREQRLLTERLHGLISFSWRTPKSRASNSCSSSSCSSVSSGYATSEWADSAIGAA